MKENQYEDQKQILFPLKLQSSHWKKNRRSKHHKEARYESSRISAFFESQLKLSFQRDMKENQYEDQKQILFPLKLQSSHWKTNRRSKHHKEARYESS